MRITFADISRDSHKTYVFVSNLILKDLKFCLDRDSIRYEVYGKKDFGHVLPTGYPIPEVKSMPGTARICRNPAVIISNLNAEQFESKLTQVALRLDDDLQEQHARQNQQALQNYKESYAWLDGQVPVADD